MYQMQCPAGEHCLRKESGVCLMWHPASSTSRLSGDSLPEIVEVSTQVLVEQTLEDSRQDLRIDAPSKTDIEIHENENTWSELIASYLTATDSLVGEVKKDLGFDRTLVTKISETAESSLLGPKNKVDELRSDGENSLYKDDYLHSFNISVDEERTGATYIELLQSYQGIFQKWQASEIQSKLKEMKIAA